MTEIVVRNKEYLDILDKTVNMFLEHRELCEELSDNLQRDVPVEEWERFCKEDYLHYIAITVFSQDAASYPGFPQPISWRARQTRNQ